MPPLPLLSPLLTELQADPRKPGGRTRDALLLRVSEQPLPLVNGHLNCLSAPLRLLKIIAQPCAAHEPSAQDMRPDVCSASLNSSRGLSVT